MGNTEGAVLYNREYVRFAASLLLYVYGIWGVAVIAGLSIIDNMSLFHLKSYYREYVFPI